MDGSFWIALSSLLVSVVLGTGGFVWNARAIRREQRDRKEALSDAWAREWGAQHALVCPHLPADYISGRADTRYESGDLLLPLKNGGRGPAFNVRGVLTTRNGDGPPVERRILAGIIAAGECLDARLDPPLQLPALGGGPLPADYLAGANGFVQYQDLAQTLTSGDGSWVTRFHFVSVSRREIDFVIDAMEQEAADLPVAAPSASIPGDTRATVVGPDRPQGLGGHPTVEG
jgi:hypothetical protein